ncbi:hypothetical protein NLJ89_g2664 [Agrocybe chaxingu]|uniref:F-box domain-containing protein n=1 Tax=Agrocybe chaxingu TaxID=84603 RepID=A0A9W8KAW1_9AGAR|nr:hypothetical protein NLJ89_g2664 [Agrocybe chaxingu]
MADISLPPIHLLSLSSSGHGPSGRLPIELLSEIFLFCVEEGIDDINTIQTPLLLSKICSRWRAAAISNHQLWSRLSIQLKGPGSNRDPALIDTWLTRSVACPLTLYVFWEEPPFEDTHPVLEKLMQHSERWHTMFFYMPYQAFRSFSSVRGRLPLLTDLSLGTDDEIESRPRNLDMFEIAPRLRSIECVNLSPTIFKFPWAQLHDIPLLSGNISECLDMLHRGKCLSKVSFIFVEGGPQAPPPPPVVNGTGAVITLPHSPGLPAHYPTVYHNHLTCFTIMTPQWNEHVDLRPLFPHLKFPHLETLTICNLKSAFGNEFTQFLSSLHTLKTLHLRKTALPDDELVEGLKHVPSLANLIVISAAACCSSGGRDGGIHGDPNVYQEEEVTVTRYLLEALTRNFFSNDAMDGMLLPKLRNLELTVSSPALRELDTFVDMLQSRLRDDEPEGLARLQHVRVRPSVDLDDEFLIRLIELRDLGLEVDVETMPEPRSAVCAC